uniref:C-type lectin domain-containing protein n=1 Tax=Seriola dumerili TaxID=41447 RepID=A0A3B4T747_SERDU
IGRLVLNNIYLKVKVLLFWYVNLRKNWTEAQSYCRMKFIDLATVNNEDDNQRLVTLALNTTERKSNNTWIGLYDDINCWKWSMEDENIYVDRDTDFFTWLNGNPDNEKGKEHCVLYHNTMNLNDVSCKNLQPFICYDGRNKLI